MDVDGNDNQPEWGYCTAEDCQEAALPIWLEGGYPDDADLFLCQDHIGAEIARLRAALRQCAQMKTIRGARRIVSDALGED
jgi:hypothetical protein